MRARFQFFEQPYIFYSNDGLACESLEEVDLFLRKGADLHPADMNHPDGNSFPQ